MVANQRGLLQKAIGNERHPVLLNDLTYPTIPVPSMTCRRNRFLPS